MKNKRLISFLLAIIMAAASISYVSYAEIQSEELTGEEIEEIVSASAVDLSAETSEDNNADLSYETTPSNEEEAEPTEIKALSGADLASDASLLWELGVTCSVSTSYSTVEYDSDGNPAKVVLNANGKGKIASNDEEFIYLATQTDVSSNFIIEADMTIDDYSSTTSNNQSSAGIALMSDPNSSNYSSSIAKERYEEGMMLRVYPGGFSLRTHDAGEASETDKLFFEVSKLASYGTNLGTYHLSVQKSSDNYIVTVTDSEGNSASEYYTTSTMFDRGDIFAGVFAAREMKVTFTNVNLKVDTKQYTGIEILSPMEQTEYYYGENINTEGLRVGATYYDTATGETGTEEVTNYAVSGFDSTVLGSHTLTVAVGDVSAEIGYSVRKMNVTDVVITSAPIKNEYWEYQYFDLYGLEGYFVFEDGTTADFDEDDEDGLNYKCYIDGKEVDTASLYFKASQAGNKTVNIGYVSSDTVSDNNVRSSFGIKIHNAVLDEIIVTSKPTKKEYVVGEEYVQSGILIQGIYTNADGFVYKYIDENSYTVDGFSSAKTGAVTMTVTLKANSDYTTSFGLNVFEKTVSNINITLYPRTTFIAGTPIDEIKTAIDEGIEVSVFYADNTYEAIKLGDDYTIDYSDIKLSGDGAAEGQYTVTVNPVSLNTAPITFNITVWEGKEHFWRRTVFGQSSKNSKWINLTEPDEYGFSEKIYLEALNNSGKITGNGHDGIAYYYTTFDPDDNFTLQADFEVVSFLPEGGDTARTGGDGFGIQFRDTISHISKEDGDRIVKAYTDAGWNIDELFRKVFVEGGLSDGTTFSYSDEEWTVDSSTLKAWKDTNLAPVSNIDDSYIDSYGQAIPVRNNQTSEFSNMVFAGAWSPSSYPTDPTVASYYFKTHNQRINMYVRTGVINAYSTKQNFTNFGPYCLYGATGDEDTGLFYPKKGRCIYHIAFENKRRIF